MAQITLYIDDELARRIRATAAASGQSLSRWVADIVRRETETSWPPEVLELAGAFPDFPDVEELRAGAGEDAPRDWP